MNFSAVMHQSRILEVVLRNMCVYLCLWRYKAGGNVGIFICYIRLKEQFCLLQWQFRYWRYTMRLSHTAKSGISLFRYHMSRRYTNASFRTQYQHLELERTMSLVYSMPVDPIYSPVFSLLSLSQNLDSLKIIHAQLIVHKLVGNLPVATKLVSMYGSYGNIKQARLVFSQIHSPDLYSWKVMLRWYFLNDSYLDIIKFYRYMRNCLREHDNIVFSIVIKACCELQKLNEGMKVHCQIIKVGNPDGFVMTGLIDLYGKCGMIDSSRQIFDSVSEKSVVSWTSMISAYVQNDCLDEGLLLFNDMMHHSYVPNEFTLGVVLSACLSLQALHQGKWVHSCIIKYGLNENSFLVTTLLHMYVKCGVLTEAYSVLDELESVDVVSWTAMIVGYTRHKHPNESLSLFINKKWADVIPNSVTLASVLSACSQLKYLKFGSTVHSIAIRHGCEEETITRNALVDMYAKCGLMDDAAFVFISTSEKDVITWNSLLGGYAENGFHQESLLLVQEMRTSCCRPDAFTMVNVISACAGIGALPIGCSFHAYATKFGFLSNVYVGTALLSFYVKFGDADSARRVFDGMHGKNMVTWSAMVGGYGVQGDSHGCLELFTHMLKGNFLPNDVILTSILFACSHTGMIDEGLKQFAGMFEDYQLVPNMKHYVCIVDLLARAGRLEEAMSFIEGMPLKPTISVWGAFLHGCKLHSRLDLGEVAVKRMLELCPDSGDYYVLASNYYSSNGKWSQATKTMDLMTRRELSKSPAVSYVGMDDWSCSSPKVAGLYW